LIRKHVYLFAFVYMYFFLLIRSGGYQTFTRNVNVSLV